MKGSERQLERRRALNSRSRGQTLTEFALVSPVLLLILFGILEASLLLFGVGTARFAAGEGARQESESGNAATADTLSIGVIRATALGTTNITQVQSIDVYRLTQAGNGVLTQDMANTNRYRLDGSPIGATPWPPSARNVTNGANDFLGITVHYRYNWKTGIFIFAGPLDLQQSFYIRLEPQTY